MSVADELLRIQTNRNTIRAKLVSLGLATSTDTLDILAGIIEDIIDRGAVTVTVREGETYTIPKGYHNGSGTVSGISGGGSYNLQSKTATPTKKQQNITPDQGYFGLSDVTINAIPENYQDVSDVTALASDVLAGKIIVTKEGTTITGTMQDNGSVNIKIDAISPSYTIPEGYHNGSGVVFLETESKQAIPTKELQLITSTEGKVLSSVEVAPIPEEYMDTSTSSPASGSDILEGKIAFANGQWLSGLMPDNGDMNKSFNALVDTSIKIPAGYTSGGNVTLTSDLEDALKAI